MLPNIRRGTTADVTGFHLLDRHSLIESLNVLPAKPPRIQDPTYGLRGKKPATRRRRKGFGARIVCHQGLAIPSHSELGINQ